MNKSGVILFALLLLLPLAAAAGNQTEDTIQKAYQCLENNVNNKSSSQLTLQEAVFGVLALKDNTKAEQKIESEKKSQTNNSLCWPKASCTIKDTAQVLLAYQRMGKSTDEIENYLLSRSGATSGLDWFLEIDIENQQSASCRIKYPGSERTLTIGSDMKLAASDLGSCLSIVPSGYWLAISPSCLDKSFTINCDQNFLSTLLYQKTGSETLFISPNTHSSTGGGEHNESISSRCFKAGQACDYEGSLWATIALDKADRDVSAYIPYLSATAEDNEALLPWSFLYKLTNGQEYYARLVQDQTPNNYWQAPSTRYNRFYDTSLALLSLQGTSSVEADNAKTYLLSAQGQNGCWNNNNLRDTAFILYAGWSDLNTVSVLPIEPETFCESVNPSYSCESSALACADAGGDILNNYECSGALYCCSVKIEQLSCNQQNGVICSASQECSSQTVNSLDGSCCLGTCQAPTSIVNECENQGGSCRSSCLSGESESSEICSESSQLCCFEETAPVEESSGSNLWIYLLIILIILVVLAIIFRRRLQLMLLRSRSSRSSSSTPIVRRPPFPPTTPMRPIRPVGAPASPRALQPSPVRRPTSQADKEMEETLKKLKEMSK